MSKKQLPKPCGLQEQADLLEEETPAPNVCLKHPVAIWYDGTCDACRAEFEFMKLTDGI